MGFCDDAWVATAPVRRAIDELPFLTGLRDGTLPRPVFVYYMAQDAHYLLEFARVMAMAAGQAEDADELVFWAKSAQSAVLVERLLHASYVADFAAIPMSPTCTAYTSFLLSLTTAGCYPALAAGVLPCFWIYEDVGRRLKEQIPDLAVHPYGDWIATYGDPEFAASTEDAKAIVDGLAARSGQATTQRMQLAFATASHYERMFWEAAWRQEPWPAEAPLV
jgi:thiaminase/transcriptional activator TenA